MYPREQRSPTVGRRGVSVGGKACEQPASHGCSSTRPILVSDEPVPFEQVHASPRKTHVPMYLEPALAGMANTGDDVPCPNLIEQSANSKQRRLAMGGSSLAPRWCPN